MVYKLTHSVPLPKRNFRGCVGSDYVPMMMSSMLSFDSIDWLTTEIIDIPIHDPCVFDYWREVEGCESTSRTGEVRPSGAPHVTHRLKNRLYAQR